jgi:Regulator of chromosome condensation (RCC1) repeat
MVSRPCRVQKVLLKPHQFRFFNLPYRGRGDDGRLGHGDTGWKYVPRIVQSLTGHVVVSITAGSYHTAVRTCLGVAFNHLSRCHRLIFFQAVTSNGHLFTWGGGMYGKLGHNNEVGT